MFDYYSPPRQDIFEDIKENAIKIWQTYGYADEKVGRIKDIQNISDNAWFIVAMFDTNNQGKLLTMVKSETAKIIKIALNN